MKKHWLCLTALLILCSLSFYSSVSAAKGSIDPVKCRVELDRNVLPVGDSQNVVVKVTLDAERPEVKLNRPKVNLSIVLDRSGSMSGEKIEKAKEAAIEALRRLGPDDICSVVIYDHNIETIIPAQSAGNIEWIESRIKSIRPGGNTALFGGVSQGASEIRKNLYGGFVNRIILLSDGIANVGPSSPEELGRLGAALLKEDIAVTTIGVGTDYNEDLMARLSQNSDGNTYFVESSRDLPRIFQAELGDVLDVVAKKVRVVIECPDNIKPVRIIGRDGRIMGQTIELSLNQLYGGQEKYALVEVTVPEGRDGQDMEIAKAEVSYINSYTQKSGASGGKVMARFSDDIKVVEKSTNVGVKKDLYLNFNALAEEKAISLSDEGKEADAAAVLKGSAEQIRAFAVQYDDKEMLDKAKAMEQQAEIIEEEGMSNKQRKYLRSKSYQMKNQQSVSSTESDEQ
ncbi:MAG: VWA domain-containing protein [Deltaproteobacteria bacterium]|nr:VWA domain-containing protein [Deltaproteobacteria bacterium]